MEQLGHVGRRVRGRWGFRYSLQTQPLTEASKKKERRRRHGERIGEKKCSDEERSNRKCVKDEKTCHGEVERREGKIERTLKEAKNKIENRIEIK